MKIFNNVLSLSLVKLLMDDVNSLKTNSNPCEREKWTSSNLCWPLILTEMSNGPVYTSSLNKQLVTLVSNEIKHLLPKHDSLYMAHYLWDKNSSISVHNDDIHLFGATIYLNRHWDIRYGGLFVYFEDNQWKTFLPNFNSLVLNDEFQDHMVTIISPNIPEFRHTIQIWGKVNGS